MRVSVLVSLADSVSGSVADWSASYVGVVLPSLLGVLQWVEHGAVHGLHRHCRCQLWHTMLECSPLPLLALFAVLHGTITDLACGSSPGSVCSS